MNMYDFTPLQRSFIGFDRMARMIDAASRNDSAGGYPPYNVEQIDEDSYRIEIAVAGFAQEELSIDTHQNVLTVTGSKSETDDSERTFLHRGLAGRGFERRFQLADHVLVTGAELVNGVLVIALKREIPEALKPRNIAIGSLNLESAANDKKVTAKKASSKGEAA